MTKRNPVPQVGRPRDASLDQKTMDATWDLLQERPLAKLTIQEIAERAGTTRPAIYRRWNSIDEIVIDAFLNSISEKVIIPEDYDPPDQFRFYVKKLTAVLNSGTGRVIAEIVGRAQSDPDLMARFKSGFLVPRRLHGYQIIERGQALGVFRSDLPPNLVMDLYAGPIYYRAFFQLEAADEAYAEQLADSVLAVLERPGQGGSV